MAPGTPDRDNADLADLPLTRLFVTGDPSTAIISAGRVEKGRYIKLLQAKAPDEWEGISNGTYPETSENFSSEGANVAVIEDLALMGFEMRSFNSLTRASERIHEALIRKDFIPQSEPFGNLNTLSITLIYWGIRLSRKVYDNIAIDQSLFVPPPTVISRGVSAYIASLP